MTWEFLNGFDMIRIEGVGGGGGGGVEGKFCLFNSEWEIIMIIMITTKLPKRDRKLMKIHKQ